MASAVRKDVSVTMRFREDDLDVIDRGAGSAGLSRTEFVRRAALHEAQMAILNETVIRMTPEEFARFEEIISAPPSPPSDKVRERLSRRAPWEPD
jgi:uncharacterized protein (DUF1778 family)